MNLLTLSSLLFVAGASAQYYDYSLNGSEKCALINVAMDESGSMDREQSFLKTNVLENIITELQGTSNNFTKVFVCSNGFGNNPLSYGVDSDGFRRIGCSLGYDPNILNWGSSSAGTHEDGYTAIIKSIDRVTAFIANLDLAQTCKTMSKNFILVSDEDRDMHIADDHVTQVSVKDRIALREYILNLVVNVHIISQETHYLGMRYNYDPAAVFVAANPPSFPNDIFKPTKQISGAFDGGYEVVTTYTDKSYNGAVEGLEQGYLETGSGKTVRDYAPLIENTEGAIWSIPSLRYGGRLANNGLLDDSHRQAFIDAFIKVKVCEIANCRGEVGSNGDPHFTTWKNEHYEFHGQCDLVLAKDSQSLFGSLDMGLDVHIRTKIVRFWSYIQSVAIRIGNDVLEIRGNGDSNNEPMYWFNYEYQGEMTTLSGFPVTHYSSSVRKRSYLIDLSSKKPGYSIQVDLYREFVGVKLNGNKNGYRNTVGLLGDPSTGKLLARDGSTEMLDYTDFGNEWQVRPFEQKLFHEMADPQFPIGCIQPEDPRGERRRRLAESSIGMEEAEIACASLHDPASVKDCVYDILSTQDLDMVGAY